MPHQRGPALNARISEPSRNPSLAMILNMKGTADDVVAGEELVTSEEAEVVIDKAAESAVCIAVVSDVRNSVYEDVKSVVVDTEAGADASVGSVI